MGLCLQFWYLSEDWSTRLIEWLEIQRAVGVEKVVMYILHVNYNMTKVQYYIIECTMSCVYYSLKCQRCDLYTIFGSICSKMSRLNM